MKQVDDDDYPEFLSAEVLFDNVNSIDRGYYLIHFFYFTTIVAKKLRFFFLNTIFVELYDQNPDSLTDTSSTFLDKDMAGPLHRLSPTIAENHYKFDLSRTEGAFDLFDLDIND